MLNINYEEISVELKKKTLLFLYRFRYQNSIGGYDLCCVGLSFIPQMQGSGGKTAGEGVSEFVLLTNKGN